MNVLIIDGYIDEPACLGVSPYMSPYPRYIAGALIEKGFLEDNIHYITIDEIREKEYGNFIKNIDILIIIAGITVPGKYFNAKPITIEEIESILLNTTGIKILGGPIRFGYSEQGGKKAFNYYSFIKNNTYIVKKDIEAFVFDIIENDKKKINNSLKKIDTYEHRFRTNKEIYRWASKGSFIVKKHPKYPNIICEIETYRGCTRKKHCSFCTEIFYNDCCKFREISSISFEIYNLYINGIKHIRLGGQSDLFAYFGIDCNEDVLKPNPFIIDKLYKSIKNVAPALLTFHMDNVNPLTILSYPEESKKIIKTIIKYHTPGDVIALGIESADLNVINKNNLKIEPDKAIDVIKLINNIGSKKGYNGMPEILPGLNFLYGLKGETKNTFKQNYEFLLNILNNNLLLRRINIRQVIKFKNTSLGTEKSNYSTSYFNLFRYYKDKIRKEIDLPMLKKIVPKGSIITSVFVEKQKYYNQKKVVFGRQFGTYPILIGLQNSDDYKINYDSYIDIVVTDHGFRSLTGIPIPININTINYNFLKEIPFFDSISILNIIKHRPFQSIEDFLNKSNCKNINENILKYIKI